MRCFSSGSQTRAIFSLTPTLIAVNIWQRLETLTVVTLERGVPLPVVDRCQTYKYPTMPRIAPHLPLPSLRQKIIQTKMSSVEVKKHLLENLKVNVEKRVQCFTCYSLFLEIPFKTGELFTFCVTFHLEKS